MASKKIVIDPITRIEGHLRIEVEVDENNVVTEAWASGQLFRGIEIILKGRDPRDAGLIAQRICGVCTNVHYRASISAVEDAYGIALPKNAEIIRNLVTLALFVQDHIVHYYHLHSLDYVDVVSALDADPENAAEAAKSYHDYPYRNSRGHLSAVKEKLGSFVKAGRLGLFANGYWGHSGYKFTPEENLVHMSHYLEALRIQRELSKAVAIFAGKTPHPQNLVVGGVTSVADMLNPQRLNDFMFILKDTRDFIERAYMPDMKMALKAYRDEIKAGHGRGSGNFLVQVLRRKLAAVELKFGMSGFEKRHYALLALMCTYGIELLADNIAECRAKMLDNFAAYLNLEESDDLYRAACYVLSQNLVHGDALTMRTWDDQPITFAEWGYLGKGKFQRRDFRLEMLTQMSAYMEKNPLFACLGKHEIFKPTKTWPPMSVSELAALEGD